MHNLRIIVVGRHKDDWVAKGCDHYQKLLRKFARVEMVIIPAASPIGPNPGQSSKKKEAKSILRALKDNPYIALANSDDQLSSESFANFVQEHLVKGGNKVTFVIGGPFGLSDEIISRATRSISLSSLTYSHQLARIVLLEQLYRAFSILSGNAYHK